MVCTQYMDDIRSGAENVTKFLRNISLCGKNLALKLSPEKCLFGKTKINVFGNILMPVAFQPKSNEIDKLIKIEKATDGKARESWIEFVQFFRDHVPKLNEILIILYEHL